MIADAPASEIKGSDPAQHLATRSSLPQGAALHVSVRPHRARPAAVR